MRAWVRLAVVGVLSTVAVAGCGGEVTTGPALGSLEETTLTFSVGLDDTEIPAVRHLLKRFQDRERGRLDVELLGRFRDKPRVVVNLVTSLDTEALDRRIEEEVRAGEPTIQLFARDNVALGSLVDRQLVEDLSDVALPPGVIDKLVPQRFAGRQFFLPFRPNVRLAYADRARLARAGAQPPRTVQELRDVARRLRDVAGEPKVTLSLAQGDPAAVTVSEWILAHGGDPLVLGDPASVRAFETLRQLWDAGLLARESLFARYDTEVRNLAGGTSWLAQNWSFTSAQLARRGKLPTFTVYPGWEGPAGGGHVIGGDVLGIPRGVTPAQRRAALDLVRFLMSSEAQEHLARANAWPSISAEANANVADDQKETFAAIQDALEHGWAGRSASHWCHVRQAMNDAVERILVRHEPLKPVLDELHARTEQARQEAATCPPSA